MGDALFERWMRGLERRHAEALRFAEIRRGVQALSSLYVGRRGRIGSAFEGRGKRAAYALYFGPLHFLLIRSILQAAGIGDLAARRVVDLGCGTGAASLAWAEQARLPPRVTAIDRSGWALDECREALADAGVGGRIRRGALENVRWPEADLVLCAFTLNELADAVRKEVLGRLRAVHRAGAAVLIVEPIARGVAPWWNAARDLLEPSGVRAGEWRFPVELPPRLRELDRAAGLDHRELTGRSLWLAPGGQLALAR